MTLTDFSVPREVAICPHCGGNLHLEVIEWEVETGTPTEGGCYVSCVKEKDVDPLHERSPYIYMLPVAMRVYAWAKRNVVVGPSREELLEKKRAFERGEPIR